MSLKRTAIGLHWYKYILFKHTYPYGKGRFPHPAPWLFNPLNFYSKFNISPGSYLFILMPLKALCYSYPSSRVPRPHSADGRNQFWSVLQLKQQIITHSQVLIISVFIIIPNFFFLLPHVCICVKMWKNIRSAIHYFCWPTDAKEFPRGLFEQEDWPKAELQSGWRWSSLLSLFLLFMIIMLVKQQKTRAIIFYFLISYYVEGSVTWHYVTPFVTWHAVSSIHTSISRV